MKTCNSKSSRKHSSWCRSVMTMSATFSRVAGTQNTDDILWFDSVVIRSFVILNFSLIGGSDYKLIYRHYATLYFVFCVDSSESELGILDLIQVFVETLDKCFENVCELDLIFHADSVHHILAELVMGGMVLQTNMSDILARIEEQNKLVKMEVRTISAIFPFQFYHSLSNCRRVYRLLLPQWCIKSKAWTFPSRSRTWNSLTFHRLSRYSIYTIYVQSFFLPNHQQFLIKSIPYHFQDLKFWPGSYCIDTSTNVLTKLTTYSSYEPICSATDVTPMNPLAANYQHYNYQHNRKAAKTTNTPFTCEDTLLSPIQGTKTKWLTSLQTLNIDTDSNSIFSGGHQPIAGANYDLPEDVCNPKWIRFRHIYGDMEDTDSFC